MEKKKAGLKAALQCDTGSAECQPIRMVSNTRELRDKKTQQFRNRLLKQAEIDYANDAPGLRAYQRRLAQMDIDHMVELQFGGANSFDNMWGKKRCFYTCR